MAEWLRILAYIGEIVAVFCLCFPLGCVLILMAGSMAVARAGVACRV